MLNNLKRSQDVLVSISNTSDGIVFGRSMRGTIKFGFIIVHCQI